MIEQTSLVRLTPDGELRASTEVIAQGMAYQRASTIKLVRRHQTRLESFGPIRFQIRMGAHGGVPVEYADLNEQQAALIVSFMRNTARVIDFKVSLIAEFYRWAFFCPATNRRRIASTRASAHGHRWRPG